MATYSQVKSALDEIAVVIREQRSQLSQAKTFAAIASAALENLQTEHADVIATISAYGTTNASEALAKADLAKLAAEFAALKADADTMAAINLDD